MYRSPCHSPSVPSILQTRHAIEVFEDSELVGLCEEGLNKQLQRTRDGATESSRIQELAGERRHPGREGRKLVSDWVDRLSPCCFSLPQPSITSH